MSAGNILDVVGCLFLLLTAGQVLATFKTHGSSSGAGIRQMARISLGGGKALLLIGGIIGLASAVLQPVLSDWIPPLPPLFVIPVALLALNGACLPPTFLLLAASREGGFSLASELEFAVPPLKMVHLLDSFQAGAVVGKQIDQSEFRVTSDWQRAVRTLSGISPVVIVDVRELTSNVYQEVVHLVEAGLHSKVFLIANEAQAPADIVHLCDQRGVRICVVTPQLLKSVLGGIGWTVLFRRVDNLFRFLELRMLSIAAARSR